MTPLHRQNRFSFRGCRGRRGGWLPAGVAVLCVVAAIPSARAEVVIHNGLSTSPSHPFGTNAVDVSFVADVEPAAGVLEVATAFNEIATHEYTYVYENPEPPLLFVDLAVVNLTGVAWTGYEFTLAGADFYGIIGGSPPTLGDLARTNNPVVTSIGSTDEVFLVAGAGDSVTPFSSAIVRDGSNALLSITFDDWVDPGELFTMAFFIDDVGPTDVGFIMTQTPTPIPAPGAVILALVGFGALGPVRRWFC